MAVGLLAVVAALLLGGGSLVGAGAERPDARAWEPDAGVQPRPIPPPRPRKKPPREVPVVGGAP